MRLSSHSLTALTVAALAACWLLSAARAQEARILDDFETIAAWRANASDGVSSTISSAPGHLGGALRLDFDFHDVSGYAFATRALPINFPDNFDISFWIRAEAPVNTLEVKFTDAAGENVWWRNQPNVHFPSAWTRVVIHRRQIEFAWGPASDHTLRHTERMEIVVTRGSGGGRGSVFIDQLELHPLAQTQAPLAPVSATATRSSPGSTPAQSFDGDRATVWTGLSGHNAITFDLGQTREFGGLDIDWVNGREASSYDVLFSDDGHAWSRARSVADGDGGRDTLLLRDASGRFVRLDLKSGPGRDYGLGEVRFHPPEWGETDNGFIESLAASAPRGVYPRGFVEQSYWTLIGADGASDNALISEDAAIEIGRGGFSIEPFVRVGDHVFTWADTALSQSLQDGYLPIPSVEQRTQGWILKTTAFVTGPSGGSTLVARYGLSNTSARPQEMTLILAARPFQVNGPRQFLNLAGGVSPISGISFADNVLSVNGRARLWAQPPSRFKASRFDSGLAPFASHSAASVHDETGFASGALEYRVTLQPGETRAFVWCAPLTGAQTGCPADIDRAQLETAQAWRARLNVIDIRTPAAGAPVIGALRSSLAHILMSRRGAALEPGSRSYDRSWIRDGAMMANALIRLGAVNEAADFLRWYAPYQFANGKVPCCVDARGADPTAENDSHGEFIFLVADVWRATHDQALLRAMWPRVESAVRHMDEMRASEREHNQSPERRHLRGLMPASISHEGYSSRPAYSYWDDFWALLGYKEAVRLAEAAGDRASARRIAASRDAFRADLYASLAAMRRVHAINYIPGAADLGDFDATSTTIALAPVGEQSHLPRAALEATFERYWHEFVARRDGATSWEAYTPYEIRNVGAFVRLGWRERANELMRYFLADRRPQSWNGWAEVVGRDPRERRFIGDMPHAWISSDYIRAVLDMFAFEREEDDALVIAAGLPAAWFDGEGIGVRDLRTRFGHVSYTVRREHGALHVAVEGDVPPGGFVFPWPYLQAPSTARFGGRAVALHNGAFVLQRAGVLVATP